MLVAPNAGWRCTSQLSPATGVTTCVYPDNGSAKKRKTAVTTFVHVLCRSRRPREQAGPQAVKEHSSTLVSWIAHFLRAVFTASITRGCRQDCPNSALTLSKTGTDVRVQTSPIMVNRELCPPTKDRQPP